MALTVRPAMVDDSGTFDNGTQVDKAFIDAAYDQIEDQTHSTTNPTIKPKAITDEVVTARGNLANLNARLAGVIDSNGVLIPSASAVTQAQAGALPQGNCVLNDTMLIWAAGDAAAPTGYVLAGTGAACARAGTGLADTKRKVGDFCAKLTFGSTALTLEQDVLPTAAFARVDHLKGTDFGYGAWVWANAANQARLYVTDGVVTTYSSYHTGDGTWQWLTVAHPASGSATHLAVGVRVESGAANPVSQDAKGNTAGGRSNERRGSKGPGLTGREPKLSLDRGQGKRVQHHIHCIKHPAELSREKASPLL